MPGDGLQHPRHILHAVSDRTYLIERRCVGDQSETGDPAVGRLEACDAAVRCRLADGPAGVGPEGDDRRAIGHRGATAA